MKKTILCLANSYKLTGRCLAGYEINVLPDNSFVPVKQNGKLKWLRPVSEELHGQIPTQWVENITLFDIVTFNVIKEKPEGYQSENVLVDVTTIERSDVQIPPADRKSILEDFVLLDYMNDESFLSEDESVTSVHNIFGNNRGDVNSEEIKQLDHSIMLIRAWSPKITFHNLKPKKPRLSFQFHGNQLDLPITDPEFIIQYQQNKNVLENVEFVYATVSLGVEFNTRYYKLVAGIFF